VVGIPLTVVLINDVCSVGTAIMEFPLVRASELEIDGDSVPDEAVRGMSVDKSGEPDADVEIPGVELKVFRDAWLVIKVGLTIWLPPVIVMTSVEYVVLEMVSETAPVASSEICDGDLVCDRVFC
jgi:hypothetical protein